MYPTQNRSSFLASFLLLLSLACTQQTMAQTPTISYPAAAQDLTRGYSQSNLTVKLVFNGICSGATTAKIALPASVTYVAGSVTKTGGSAAMSITEGSITDLRNPVFNITGIAAIGDNITFTVARSATCGSLATSKDSIYVFTSGGCSNGSELVGSVNTYNILSPSLAITPPAALTNTVTGTTATRTTTITNGGNGALDTLRYYVVYPAGGIVNTSGTNAITANGSSFTPSSTSGDTLFYKIYGATLFGGNNLLSNGETVTITEPIKVVKCNTTTAYGAGWGKTKATQCQVATGTSTVTMANGIATVAAAVISGTPAAPCITGYKDWKITNNGTGGNAGAMYSVIVALNSTTTKITLSNANVGGTAATLSSSGGYSVNMSQFTTDPDGAGGLEDLDGDGQFDDLAPGNSFVLHFTEDWICSNACPISYNSNDQVIVNYKTMCGNTASTAPIVASINSLNVTSASAFAPSFVYGGQAFTARICVAGTSNNAPGASWPTDSLYLKLTLPAGLAYVPGTASMNGVAIPSADAFLVGSDLYIRKKGSLRNTSVCVEFQLIYTCSASNPTLNIPLELYNVKNSACSCAERLFCSTITTTPYCPGGTGCANGMGNNAPNAERLSLGWTDATMSTKVTAASLNSLSKKSAVPFDTVKISQSAISGEITYNNLYYQFTVNKASGATAMIPAGGTLFFKRGTTTFSCVLPSVDSSSSTATQSIYKWNLSSLFGTCMTGITGMQPADSVSIAVNYTVTNANNGLLFGNVQTQAPGTTSYFYNLDTASASVYCGGTPVELYLIGLQSIINAGQSSNSSACNDATSFSINTALIYGDATDLFPSEYRPQTAIDSIVLTWPASDYTFTNLSAALRGSYWSSAYINVNTSFLSLSPSTNIAGKLTYVNAGGNSWPTSDLSNNSANNSSLSLSLTGWQPTCATKNSNFNYTVYYKNNYYRTPAAVAQTVTSSSYLRGYISSSKAAISVQNNTGTVQGVSPQQYWDVQVNSIGASTASYIWLALEKSTGSGGISIDSVVLKPSNVKLTPATYNTTDKWYQASVAGLASGSSQQARVYFKYSSCAADSILLKSGWNCSGYPSPDPLTGYACSAAQTYLKVIPQPSQVQLSIARQPGGGSSINLCTTDSALLIVNSAQSANLVNPYVIFYPPAGVTMASTIQVEYPLGSGNYQNAAITSVAGGGYQIDLTAHTAIGPNGMLGTASANPAFSPLGGDRQAKIKLAFSTGCGFSSGSSFSFSAYGNQPCGSAATGNGVTATTAALNINGVTVSGSAGVSIGFGSTTSASCGTAIPVSLTTTPTSVGTSAGDTMVYTLPIGLAYAGGITPGFTADTSGTGGATVIKIAMPIGVTASTPISYSFNVVPNGAGCGNSTITGAYQRAIAPLNCGGTPCTGSSVIIASATSPSIMLNKPNLTLTSLAIDSTHWVAGQYQNVYIKYNNNNSYQAYTGNTDSVEFFCGSNPIPFAVRPLTKSLATGASDSDKYWIYIPKTACATGDLVTAKIQTKTTAGTQQCLCNPSSLLLAGVPLPLEFLSAGSKAADCAVTINWSYSKSATDQLQAFEIERSNNGSSFVQVAVLPILSQTYIDIAPGSGTWFYRIKAVTADGKAIYSKVMQEKTSRCAGNTINIYPNPAQDRLQVLLQGPGNAQPYTLYDMLGKVMMQGVLQANTNNTLDVSILAKGTYVLRIVSDNSSSAYPVTISK